MDFKNDRSYSFTEFMPYGFIKTEKGIMADGHAYMNDNSFEAMLEINADTFLNWIKKSDDKSGNFEKACNEWLASDKNELFLPDVFPDPVHCKIKDSIFHFQKFETEEDELGTDRIFYFTTEAP